MGPLALVFGLGILGVLFAGWLARDVLQRDRGTPEMQEVSDAIYVGAMAFLRRQYTTIILLALVSCVVVGVVIAQVENSTTLGFETAITFLVGAGCSALAGFIGMYISVQANIRAASAARRSLNEAIQTALRGGAVSGFLVVALSLLGVGGMFALFGGLTDPARAPFQIVGFGFGASFVALFAQLGGGIFTKAADVGADLVGKVEENIPEDDPRNAAVIADLVGDNVGDCAGRGADLFESTAAESIGAMILGVALYAFIRKSGMAIPNPEYWILFPLVVRALGIVSSASGLFVVKARPGENAMNALNRGYFLAATLSAILMFGAATYMLGSFWFGLAGLVGLVTSIAFVYITQYYTAGSWRPVQEIAKASLTGPATNIIAGTAVGFECTASTAISIGIALISSYWLGIQGATALGIPLGTAANQLAPHAAGVLGTAIATMGMLMTAAYILAMDTFGPITDNAGGIVEMSHQAESTRAITDELDSVGNTTKALTKGYAIGSAALAAFLLFSAYIDKVNEVIDVRNLTKLAGAKIPHLVSVDLANVNVFVAALLGAMLVYLFSSLAIRAVGRASQSIILEVRRQFREDPGIMLGTSKPDYNRCVDITTRAALKEMVAPGVLAVAFPILVGVILGHEAVAGMLMVGTISGVILATVLNNGGGAWDNAKKYIESGMMKDDAGNIIRKGSPAHAASVVGDTVGDPYKDTAGPSLHVLVKLLSTITLVLAPLFVR